MRKYFMFYKYWIRNYLILFLDENFCSAFCPTWNPYYVTTFHSNRVILSGSLFCRLISIMLDGFLSFSEMCGVHMPLIRHLYTPVNPWSNYSSFVSSLLSTWIFRCTRITFTNNLVDNSLNHSRLFWTLLTLCIVSVTLFNIKIVVNSIHYLPHLTEENLFLSIFWNFHIAW